MDVSIESNETKSQVIDILQGDSVGSSDSDHSSILWWQGFTKQSERGVLLKVQNERQSSNESDVTELLLYATVEEDGGALPSTPPSSSPAHGEPRSGPFGDREIIPAFRFHALPLCSRKLQYVQQASRLCTPPPEKGEAFFVPDDLKELEAAMKRRKISSAFEAATKQRRKSKAKGGEGVAKAMASLERSNSQLGIAKFPLKERNPSVPAVKVQRASLTRASTDGSLCYTAEVNKPTSRPSTAMGGKRSSLHRAESAYLPREGSILSNGTGEISDQNKAALSKIVMAGMRVHGLQQRRKATREISQSAPTKAFSTPNEGGPDIAGEDEYKLVYHQTLKAATFAFRAHANVKAIGQEAMRDVVDRLLDVFCADPLRPAGNPDFLTPGLPTCSQEHDNPFDAPSSSALEHSGFGCSTPITKKRKAPDHIHDPG